jgi:hypothetical protein
VFGKEAIDFAPFLAGVQYIREQTGHPAIVASHHTGWREAHPRGHTSLADRQDVMICLDVEDRPTLKPVERASNRSKTHSGTASTGKYASFAEKDTREVEQTSIATVTLKCTKNRHGEPFSPIAFTVIPVPIDRCDEFGNGDHGLRIG